MRATTVRTGPSSLVVVGASLAGVRAVEAARKAGFAGRITLIGDERHLPYDRPPLSKDLLAPGGPIDPVTFRSRAELVDELGVELLLDAPATGLDPEAQVVDIGGDDVAYDALVVATGAAARSLPGTENLVGVHVLRTLDDARAVRRALDEGARTVVVGAGFIGSEVASAARKRGLPATIVEALPTPLVRSVGPDLGLALASLHTRNGTALRCGQSVDVVEGTGRVEGVRLADGTVIDADLVVVGIGAVPRTEWLAGSGLPVENGVICDEFLRAGAPGVYAAGDVARWHNVLFDRSMRVEHWSTAAEQGARAARNALSPAQAQSYATVPYFWSDWYGSRIQFAGVATNDGYEIVSGDPAGDHFVALYREGDRLTGVLTLNGQRHVMKYRRLIAQRARFDEAVAFAQTVTPTRSTATATSH
ncbi:FAD-dependent pyridine nucleotide-disulphide oxidoreductase [Kribbella flavida DSM 17836]|uniref:FAD-dependent pyridine nucleotide-disulphide oxidoreductase n=1 Tax=Kribbella flavida (strain DSM 17836 / JCM 10339 / NBRC 14399) TaxID=479435 RepID=D2PSK7_KRIFD|nr:FAD-dependent oxidoreductase [Kribbella flavida]ADB33145.1 FAD-dependent pyridine nucleotide-disulphide oxidoreductase [Kribbella flavida DSM 17836]